ncbi:MAG TPA: non-homologous end-joining DNA ligase [Acidobacteriaceae bacterium]|nr:non-homologous end-joining DNA ligase [Acidobacteriaceae bacterium]
MPRISQNVAARILFPQSGFSTDDLVRTYEALAPVLLPHLAGRPLTLKRFPDDIRGEAFWEKDAPSFTPRWVKTLPVPRKHEPGAIRYISIPDVRTLRWAASMGCIEIHAFLHRYPYITSPTLIAFDLDPGEGASLVQCCAVALLVREWLSERGLESLAKASGSKGLQVYVPLNTPTSYAITHAVARRLAEDLERERPEQIISRMGRAERRGKVFIDWSQNMEHKTTVAVYSVRAKREEPFVSMPLQWEEVEHAAKARDAAGLSFSPEAAIRRVQKVGDLFAPLLTLEQTIPRVVPDELGIPPLTSAPQPVQLIATAPAQTLPRSSGQGGRRLFVIHRAKKSFELGLEIDDKFERLALPELPLKTSQSVSATTRQPAGLHLLTEESEESGIVWDLGTYEVVEGSYAKGAVQVYFSGRKLDGEWRLRRIRADQWQITNAGGRLLHDFAGSALAGLSAATAHPKRRRAG